jgi:hypothetical protein
MRRSAKPRFDQRSEKSNDSWRNRGQLRITICPAYLRISVRPHANQTRTPGGGAIIRAAPRGHGGAPARQRPRSRAPMFHPRARSRSRSSVRRLDQRSDLSAEAIPQRPQRERNAVFRPAGVSTVGGAMYRADRCQFHAYARSRQPRHASTGSPQRSPASGPTTSGAGAQPR